MPCDGSHVLFIGGYHHSGTGAVTHALKDARARCHFRASARLASDRVMRGDVA